jgi:hypothetical protein
MHENCSTSGQNTYHEEKSKEAFINKVQISLTGIQAGNILGSQLRKEKNWTMMTGSKKDGKSF